MRHCCMNKENGKFSLSPMFSAQPQLNDEDESPVQSGFVA